MATSKPQVSTASPVRYLVQPLFDGPVDVVGDIHGEIDALNSLLKNLGHASNGSHPEGRRLVFLGDLTDRGPDSPAVFTAVRTLVDSGLAQCVLGNHDLNILLGEVKHDNHWFFGEEWPLDKSGIATPAAMADDRVRTEVLAFFRSLPLVLEREDVRVVHACWENSMIEIARNASDVLTLYHQFSERIDADHESRNNLDETDRSLERQNRNPVKVLTSGLERRSREPFWASGKLRNEERVPWWEDYKDQSYCVFGHYGFRKGDEPRVGRAFCVDFGIGKRWQERKRTNFNGRFEATLGAVRFPELVLIFDDGRTERLAP